jgi:tRNA pseudouridine38-40 synthase
MGSGKMKYLIRFSYDGSKFNGYATQKTHDTVQDKLEDALTTITGKHTRVYASGRTDCGVHALEQSAHFNIDTHITLKSLKKALNGLIKPYIYIKGINTCDDDFHARFSVKNKIYEYRINVGKYNPLEVDYTYQYNQYLDINLMIEASKYLIGEHNFKSFTKSDDIKDSYVRTIYDISIKKVDSILKIRFNGNGFMRYQVRNMVGTLIEVGNGKREPSDIKIILEKEDRSKAGKTAPACGLYLVKVNY